MIILFICYKYFINKMLSPRKNNLPISPVKENARDLKVLSKEQLIAIINQSGSLNGKSTSKGIDNNKVLQASPSK